MKTKLAVFMALMMFSCAGGAFAEELSVDQIIEKANIAAYYRGADGVSDVRMSITDSQDRKRVREFRILRLTLEQGGDQKFYVYFKKPADVSKMVFMVWKHLDSDDDRWLYLPALDLVRRIAASDNRSSFVGSHFVYEDVSGRGIEADTHELMETDDKYYKIKNVPKDVKGVEFKYYLIWIDKTDFIPMKAEYYNDQDQMVRTIEALEVEDIDGHPTVTRSLARDMERGGETTMDFTNTRYEVGLTEDVFTERFLRRAPVKWIK
ncbi:MAG: outer membrane lipoprotein-sorting protein [Candidatus Omnitrophica bacterium]|nr:outer membrane lipoprotein-sorting protein [Candidatus Omnitrophota bacterium]MCK5259431.1 outer membrane lipoprotein-sorting protein [Candidatus Omnitrophota bacterium]